MNALLDILVPLANVGASGICIFGVFMTAGLIRNAAEKPHPALFKSINQYMVMCTGMAIISAITGIYNAAYNQGKVIASEEKVAQFQGALSEQTNALLAANKTIDKLSQNQVTEEVSAIPPATQNAASPTAPDTTPIPPAIPPPPSVEPMPSAPSK